MYYTNAITAVLNSNVNPGLVYWSGYPQYDEFTFYRTRGIEGHKEFVSKSATTYNWTTYVSYASRNNYDQRMHHKVLYGENGVELNQYTVSDGVPYYIKNQQDRGKNFITFYCGHSCFLKHMRHK